jgi:hypothetical protein
MLTSWLLESYEDCQTDQCDCDPEADFGEGYTYIDSKLSLTDLKAWPHNHSTSSNNVFKSNAIGRTGEKQWCNGAAWTNLPGAPTDAAIVTHLYPPQPYASDNVKSNQTCR